MIEQWIAEVKEGSSSGELGMILIHNGIVRATSKDGKKVKGMYLTYDKEKLNFLIDVFGKRDGIVAIKAWINEGNLNVGDDIMRVLVAGRLRTYVLPTFEELISRIKNEVVSEEEFSQILDTGVAVYDPENPCSIEKLLKKADTSMYKQKRKKQKDISLTLNQ